ncbi:FliM/FliN family flagellar motor switch protein [Tautonia rosea]|uniref:FliM/FliN family flagellar motor switch protein n=1 Tax=Tautonia rosea TaxID=2728037 RepID=UPI0014754634|nr:FliM/FliN family flagellar motor switch protein [Tautonia rosea]
MSPPPNDPEAAPDPLGSAPSLARRHARLADRLRQSEATLRPLLDELEAMIGASIVPNDVDLIPRASGLKRPGAIAQCSWPRLGTRIGLGIEPSLAHALVDRLLGFDRKEAEHKLQVSPIEWGILGFVVARLLDRLAESPGPFGPWDLYLDRVGPEPFPPDGLGPIVTLAWPLQVGPVHGVVRLWVPEMLLGLALVDEPPAPPITDSAAFSRRFAGLHVPVRVVVGSLTPPEGRPDPIEGEVLPLSLPEGLPAGVPESPEGPPVLLVLGEGSTPHARALAVGRRSDPEGHSLTVLSLISPGPEADSRPDTPPALPLDLVVELGRLHLPLARVAELRPGDVLDLGHSPDDPVLITSGGDPVAHGTLVSLDGGLGVRITRLFV